jgi:hypothetical protein
VHHAPAAPLLLAVLFASAARAQTPETVKHEFGVDLTAAYAFATGGGSGAFVLQTPVDVRINFAPRSPMSLEARFSFSMVTGGGATLIGFDPGVNVLFRMGQRQTNPLTGTYLTVGASVQIVSISGSLGGSSNEVALNAGIGTRTGSGTSLTRFEGFVGYMPDSSVFQLGLRAGLSFFR